MAAAAAAARRRCEGKQSAAPLLPLAPCYAFLLLLCAASRAAGEPEKYLSVAIGGDFGTKVCAIRADGRVECWSQDLNREEVQFLQSHNATAVSLADTSTCVALAGSGEVRCFGLYAPQNFTSGLKPVKDMLAVAQPVFGPAICGRAAADDTVTCVPELYSTPGVSDGCGMPPGGVGPVRSLGMNAFSYVCAVTTANALKCWKHDIKRANTPVDFEPSELAKLASLSVTDVAVGGFFICVRLAVDSTVRCVSGKASDHVKVPTDIGPVSAMTAGYTFLCVVQASTSKLICFQPRTPGPDSYNRKVDEPTTLAAGSTAGPAGLSPGNTAAAMGALGMDMPTPGAPQDRGVSASGYTALRYDAPADLCPTAVLATGVKEGDMVMCAISNQGYLRCFSNRAKVQEVSRERLWLGQSRPPPGLASDVITQLALSHTFTMALTSTGQVRIWGDPLAVSRLPTQGVTKVASIAAADGGFGCFITAAPTPGLVKCFTTEELQNGIVGFYTLAPTPSDLGPASALAITGLLKYDGSYAADFDFDMACAIRSVNGTVRCWYLRGDPEGTIWNVPEQSAPAKSIAIAQKRACVVRATDRKMVCFRVQFYTALGAVLALPDDVIAAEVASFCLGPFHTCAIKAAAPGGSEGELACWKEPDGPEYPSVWNGAPNISAIEDVMIKVPADLGNVKSVACGSDYICAVTSDGRTVCWPPEGGWSQHFAAQVPEAVAIAKAVSVASTWTHSCAIMEGGGVKCWGTDWGDGSGADSCSPPGPPPPPCMTGTKPLTNIAFVLGGAITNPDTNTTRFTPGATGESCCGACRNATGCRYFSWNGAGDCYLFTGAVEGSPLLQVPMPGFTSVVLPGAPAVPKPLAACTTTINGAPAAGKLEPTTGACVPKACTKPTAGAAAACAGIKCRLVTLPEGPIDLRTLPCPGAGTLITSFDVAAAQACPSLALVPGKIKTCKSIGSPVWAQVQWADPSASNATRTGWVPAQVKGDAINGLVPALSPCGAGACPFN